MKKKKVSKRQ